MVWTNIRIIPAHNGYRLEFLDKNGNIVSSNKFDTLKDAKIAIGVVVGLELGVVSIDDD